MYRPGKKCPLQLVQWVPISDTFHFGILKLLLIKWEKLSHFQINLYKECCTRGYQKPTTHHGMDKFGI